MQGYSHHHTHHKSKNSSNSFSHMKSSLRLKPKTLLEKQQIIKVNTILAHLLNHSDSVDFREPVDFETLELADYPEIVRNPMDLGTVGRKLKEKKYKTVEQILNQIQLVWDNCKLYNPNSSPIYALADKLESVFRRMIRNYLPQLKVSAITSAPQRPFLEKPFTIIYEPNREQESGQNEKQESRQKKTEQAVGIEKKMESKEDSNQKKQQIRRVVLEQKQCAAVIKQKQNSTQAAKRKKKGKKFNLLEQKKVFVEKLYSLSIEDLEQIITVIQEECPDYFSELDEDYAQINVEGMDQLIFLKANQALQQILGKK